MAYTTIDDPTLHFRVKTYSGTGSAASVTFDITDTSMQPDLVWIKNRSTSGNHGMWDSVRGATKQIYPNQTYGESTAANSLTAFNSNGFSVGSDGDQNGSGNSLVAWCWKANGTGSSDTNGTINTAATSANTTAGFSIVSYTGNASSSQTVGHGLGAVPHWIISKNRDNTSTNYNDWIIYHHKNATANDKKLKLNTNDAVSSTNEWGDTDPTSTVYSVHTSGDGATNDGTDKIVSYVWTSIQGYSKFTSYTGNGSSDGTFVYLGFRPAFFIIKRTDSADGWLMGDEKRIGYNNGNYWVEADVDSNEDGGTADRVDILSNGLKMYNSWTKINASGGTYIVMAFADSPFVNSKGVPCNAR